MIWVRALMMLVCPLKLHSQGIVLSNLDQYIFLQAKEPLKHDLMFSGHMSSLCSMGFVLLHAENPLFLLLFFCAFVVMILMMFSKMHYTIDFLVAIPTTFMCYRLACNLLNCDPVME
jgi:hypothetical protein